VHMVCVSDSCRGHLVQHPSEEQCWRGPEEEGVGRLGWEAWLHWG